MTARKAARYATRDEWLAAAVEALRPLFVEQGATIPAVRVSCGWPGGSGRKTGRIGECWPTSLASDKVAQVFISPVLNDPAHILATLTHELVHAVDDCKSGHKGYFRTLATALGLEGKMTATTVNAALALRLAAIALKLGTYEHGALKAPAAGAGKGRMRKCACGRCGFIIYTTTKWIEQYGEWDCPCGGYIYPA